MTRGTLRLLASVAALAGLALACAGTHPAPQFAWDTGTDFAAMKQFAWWDPPGFHVPHGDAIVDGTFIDQHVRAAVDRELEKKGYQKTDPAQATILVSYGTGDTGTDAEDRAQDIERWTGNATMTAYENQRSLTIKFRTPSKKLVWRGSVVRLEGHDPSGVGAEIDREVSELLSHFPPRK
jgi:hypothetical protein